MRAQLKQNNSHKCTINEEDRIKSAPLDSATENAIEDQSANLKSEITANSVIKERMSKREVINGENTAKKETIRI
jgi:hypothetical protein